MPPCVGPLLLPLGATPKPNCDRPSQTARSSSSGGDDRRSSSGSSSGTRCSQPPAGAQTVAPPPPPPRPPLLPPGRPQAAAPAAVAAVGGLSVQQKKEIYLRGLPAGLSEQQQQQQEQELQQLLPRLCGRYGKVVKVHVFPPVPHVTTRVACVAFDTEAAAQQVGGESSAGSLRCMALFISFFASSSTAAEEQPTQELYHSLGCIEVLLVYAACEEDVTFKTVAAYGTYIAYMVLRGSCKGWPGPTWQPRNNMAMLLWNGETACGNHLTWNGDGKQGLQHKSCSELPSDQQQQLQLQKNSKGVQGAHQ